MTRSVAFRILIALAGVMGGCGVALAAMAAHLPDAARLGSASTMLLFHALAAIAAVLLCDRGLVRALPGVLAAFGFVIGALLFAGDLTLRQFAGHGLFPMAAPSGGNVMILSWLVLAGAALAPPRR
ncbi:DUF423 domain-containing protein [Rhodopseudomonas palustris]|uniref:DUF423 domain-containing protein n=1 Tax=Rhodopseudomonas palustris (strain BisB18) TaxID=316056 RepID=Q21B50_RHOPB